MTEAKLLTLGQICRELGNVPIHKIEYLLRSRKISPISRAGNLRIFDPKVVGILRKEIERSRAIKRET